MKRVRLTVKAKAMLEIEHTAFFVSMVKFACVCFRNYMRKNNSSNIVSTRDGNLVSDTKTGYKLGAW